MEIKAVDILLVEDNSADVELTLRALKKYHLANRIVVLNDGEEALNYLFARGRYRRRKVQPQPKIILLDLKLPKIDGLEVLRAIKADEKTRMIPVVVLTSSREESDLMQSYQLGVNSYIVKPVDFDHFLEVVKQLGMYWLFLNEISKNMI